MKSFQVERWTGAQTFPSTRKVIIGTMVCAWLVIVLYYYCINSSTPKHFVLVNLIHRHHFQLF